MLRAVDDVFVMQGETVGLVGNLAAVDNPYAQL